MENVNTGHPAIQQQQQQECHHITSSSSSSGGGGGSSYTSYLQSLTDPANPEAAQAAAIAAEASAPFQRGMAAQRQTAAVALGPAGFAALIQRVTDWCRLMNHLSMQAADELLACKIELGAGRSSWV
jgi:hypothetical protein